MMPEDEAPLADEKRPQIQRRVFISRFMHLSGVKGVITWLGAVASLIAALVGATYLIAPDLKPRDKLGATVDRIGIQQNVDYRYYDHKMDAEEPLSPRDEPTLIGIEVLVRASLYGFSDRAYSVQITLLESESLKGIHATDQPLHSTCEILSPKANEHGVTWRCWAQAPPPGTRYIVRAEIYDDGQYKQLNDPAHKDVLLDFLDSPALSALPSS